MSDPEGTRPADSGKPKLAVWKFASCDGCQLTLLNCEDELLALAGAVQIAYFPEATRAVGRTGRTTSRWSRARSPRPEDVERIQRGPGDVQDAGHHRRLRHQRWHPGAAQLRRRRRASGRSSTPPRIPRDPVPSTPISEHVSVDFELRGCPINSSSCSRSSRRSCGGKPRIPPQRVCRVQARGNVCVAVADGTPCLGPVTQAGCGALCPTFTRGCYGCFGPRTPRTRTSRRCSPAAGASAREGRP